MSQVLANGEIYGKSNEKVHLKQNKSGSRKIIIIFSAKITLKTTHITGVLAKRAINPRFY